MKGLYFIVLVLLLSPSLCLGGETLYPITNEEGFLMQHSSYPGPPPECPVTEDSVDYTSETALVGTSFAFDIPAMYQNDRLCLSFDISGLSSPVATAVLYIKCFHSLNTDPGQGTDVQISFVKDCLSNPLDPSDWACFSAVDTTLSISSFVKGVWREIPLRASLFDSGTKLNVIIRTSFEGNLCSVTGGNYVSAYTVDSISRPQIQIVYEGESVPVVETPSRAFMRNSKLQIRSQSGTNNIGNQSAGFSKTQILD